jgi:hypothetical protein
MAAEVDVSRVELIDARRRAGLPTWPAIAPARAVTLPGGAQASALLPSGEVVTLGEGTIELPEHLAWWVRPAGEDLEAFAAAVAEAELPGVDLSGLTLKASDLKRFAGQPGLRWLRLADTSGLKSAALKQLASLPALEWLDLAGAGVTTGFAALEDLPLRWLDLSRTPGLKATGLKAVGRLSSLETLDLAGSGVTDKGAKQLAGLTALQALDLSWDEACIRARKAQGLYAAVPHALGVEGAGLRELGALPDLAVLAIRHIYLRPVHFRRLRDFAALRALDLGRSTLDDEAEYPYFHRMEQVTDLSLAGSDPRSLGVALRVLPPAVRRLDLRESGLGSGHVRALAQSGELLQTVLLPARATDADAEALQRALPGLAIEREPALGWVAFEVTAKARSGRVHLPGHEPVPYIGDAVPVRVASLEVPLLWLRHGRDRAWVTATAPRAFPTAEAALAAPLPIPHPA